MAINKQKIVSFYHRNKRMPTYREVADLFEYKSKNAASKLIGKLADEGFVSKDALGRLIPGKMFDEVRILGSVKAGFASAIEEESYETMSLNDYLIEKKEATYLLEVDGDSMIDAHIADGDMVIAERTTVARDGQIVIAEVDGEFTMKYFRRKGSNVWLEAANKNYPPIYPERELKIAAVVKGVIRKY